MAEEIPDGIQRLVYLSAFSPTTAEAPSAMALAQLPEAVEDFRRVNMPEATLAQTLAILNFGMQHEDGAQTQFADARVGAERWGRVPRSYIRLTEDNVLSAALVTRMIADADRLTPDNPFDVHSLAAGHAGVVLRARELAALLDGLA